MDAEHFSEKMTIAVVIGVVAFLAVAFLALLIAWLVTAPLAFVTVWGAVGFFVGVGWVSVSYYEHRQEMIAREQELDRDWQSEKRV